MDHLRAENFPSALGFLTKAVNLLETPDLPVKLKAITLNNLGCFYKRTGKLKVALQYLHKALDLDVSSPADRTNLAGTHLNVCAIHSTLGSHDVAIRHAYEALELLKEAELTPNNAATVAIAYHNAGVEEEHLKNYERAADLYVTGWKSAAGRLGQSHGLTVSLKESYQALLETKSKVSGGRSGKDMKLPSIPKRKSFSKSQDTSSYRKHYSKSVVNTRDSTPDRALTSLEPVKSAPGSSHPMKHKRAVSNGRPPRSFRFKKVDANVSETRTQPKKLPTLAVWKRLQYAAVTIQRHWRGFKVRQSLQTYEVPTPSNGGRRREAERMAKEALAELELLKLEVLSTKLMKNAQNSIKFVRKTAFAGKISGYVRPNSRNFHATLTPIPESSGEGRKGRLRQIQARIRGVVTRRTFIRKEQAATTIQKHVRSRGVRVLFHKVLEAVSVIQDYWRQLRLGKVTTAKSQ